jgi:hypothetical protein
VAFRDFPFRVISWIVCWTLDKHNHARSKET